MELKAGVSIRLLQPQMALGANIVDGVFSRFGHPCVITAGDDGKHMEGSLHYKGLALDFRLPGLPPTSFMVAGLLRTALGEQFDVVLEETHLHVEFDPKDGPVAGGGTA